MWRLFDRPAKHQPSVVGAPDDRAWVFVSHASADLANVRRVRNYLEEKGASPLLFHLRALSHPKEFWPLIEREIKNRNFFLYCDSEAAQASEWVRRERKAVEKELRSSVKRIGRVRVDGEALDFSVLDEFVAETRVFLSYSLHDRPLVLPFAETLRAAGFGVFDYAAEGTEGPTHVDDLLTNEIALASQTGFVVLFTSNSLATTIVEEEEAIALHFGARLIWVQLTKDAPSYGFLPEVFPAWGYAEDAPKELVRFLLTK